MRGRDGSADRVRWQSVSAGGEELPLSRAAVDIVVVLGRQHSGAFEGRLGYLGGQHSGAFVPIGVSERLFLFVGRNERPLLLV